MSEAERQTTPALSARGFSKTFSGRTVLSDVDLDVLPGEVHGLLGQNGSGKSTFIKILAGYHEPDDGATAEGGRPAGVAAARPRLAAPLGISLRAPGPRAGPEMSVLENLRVGHYETRALWRIPWRQERRLVRESLRPFGLGHIDPDAEVRTLREVERALLAIVRAFDRLKSVDGGVLVLDEPTAYLPRDGVDRLFAAVRTVAAEGHRRDLRDPPARRGAGAHRPGDDPARRACRSRPAAPTP